MLALFNRKRFIILLIGLLLIFFLCLYMNCITDSSWSGQQGEKILTVKEMKKDLDYLIDVLSEVHPQTFYGWSEDQQNLISQVYDQVSNPMADWQFYFKANRIIHSLSDSHSGFSPGMQDEGIIDFPIYWLEDGLYIIENTNTFQKGDRVVSIGGRLTEQILDELTWIISAENDYWVKVLGAKMLQTRPVLSYLELSHNNKLNIEIERDGAVKQVQLSLDDIRRTSLPSIFQSGESFVSYKIEPEHSLGIFILDQCIFDDEYIRTLERFFLEVSKNNINHIVIDLRNNTGGNSLVIDEFLKFLDVRQYKTYGVEIRFSSYSKDTYGFSVDDEYEYIPSTFKKNIKMKKDQNLIFKGNIYVLTSPRTYSSANDFAVTIKDNPLGMIVGEPTGNAPSSYGDILPFQLPNSGYQFAVSYKKFIRPNPENDPEDALYPDIPVFTTIEDIKQGIDPQMDKIRELIKQVDFSGYR